MTKTFQLISFGCKSNQYDSQLWRELLLQGGWQEGDGGQADIVLVNSCSVTAAAEEQARQAVRKCKKQNAKGKVIVVGCYGQLAHEALGAIPEIDLVAGPYNPDNVRTISKFLGLKDGATSLGISGFAGHTRAFLRVQDGCDHACSYCVVPRARGRSRSRDLAEAVAEARRLIDNYYKEVVITGIRLGDFKPSLRVLLRALASLPGLERIRLSSLEPDDVAMELVEAMAENPAVARHLHLPLQSGDDGILKAMNRPYTMGQYRSLLEDIRRQVPSMTFGTDIIVGFPGETEEQFGNSYRAVQELPITRLHVFSYSRRPGTPAAAMAGQIPTAIKKERSARLREMFRDRQMRYWESQQGSETAVLFERRDSRRWSGLGEHYFRVSVDSDHDLKNSLRPVRLTSADGEGMAGELA
jgi:threonylcarbamoyladenosine tRNA methylthiotransferase MtaB